MKRPFSNSLLHIVNVPKSGATLFVPLTELIEGLTDQERSRWDRLWMVSDRRLTPFHPLMYNHPLSKKKTLCFHCGMTTAFVWDYGKSDARTTSPEETQQILDEITSKCENEELQYRHEWKAGDFIITDNLAVGHFASPETQFSVQEVGLRVSV